MMKHDTQHEGRACTVLILGLTTLVGCAAPGQEKQLRALEEQLAGLRAEVRSCRGEIGALREAQKTFAADLVRTQKAAVRGLMNELVRSSMKAMKRLGMLDPDPGKDTPGTTRQRPPAPRKPHKTFNASRWVKRVGKHRYTIKRRGLNLLFSNTTLLAKSARIVPSIRNGKPNGFKLYAIRPGSIYHALGLKNGDTIERIDGMEVTTPDKALEVYTKIRSASAITITLRRKGRRMDFEYRVVD